jgi:hypothetical protein
MLNRLVFSLCVTAALAFAAEPGFTHAAAKSGDVAYAVLAPGDIVLPQIANGTVAGGQTYATVFEAFNLTDNLARIDIVFYDSNGNAMNLPLLNQGQTVSAGSLSGSVQAHGFARAETLPANAAVQVGYAIVTSNPVGAVAVVARFGNRVPGERLFQAAIPLETTQHQRFHLGFTNTGNTVSSLAVVSASQQTVTFTARDFNGQTQCSTTRAFSARQHLAVILTDLLPCTANTNGLVDVQGTTTGLSGVGFLANDRGLGSFVTQQVYGARVP